jgi:hypothetical protein
METKLANAQAKIWMTAFERVHEMGFHETKRLTALFWEFASTLIREMSSVGRTEGAARTKVFPMGFLAAKEKVLHA